MAKIKQYRPAFFYGFAYHENEFSSLHELMELEWVKNFTTIPEFHRFSINIGNLGSVLMAEQDGGYRWWVVGYLYDFDFLWNELPVWEAKYKKRRGIKK